MRPSSIAPTPYTLNAVQPSPPHRVTPTTRPGSRCFQAENNLFTGATAIVSDGCSSACGQSTYVDQGTSYPILSWTAEDALVATYTSQGKKANIIQAASIEGGQITEHRPTSSLRTGRTCSTPMEAASTADWCGPPARCTALCIHLRGDLPRNRTYWQDDGNRGLPGNPGAANYGQGCVAGATEPAFTGAGPYTETATYPCTWTKVGAHAPPQDVSCSPSFTGTNCYSIAITNIVGSGGTVTVSLAAAPTFTYPDSITIAGITNSSYTALNNTWVVERAARRFQSHFLRRPQLRKLQRFLPGRIASR